MKKRGYTLVELLVVIAIIAILAAMVMPVLLQAKDAARMRGCADGMRQLGHAIMRYMDDHSGFGLPQSPPEYHNPWIVYVEPLCPAYTGQGMANYRRSQQTSSASPYTILPEERPKWMWICSGDINRAGSNQSDELYRPCWWRFGASYLYPGPTAYLSGTWEMDKKNTLPRKPLTWRNPKRNILLADYYSDFHSGVREKRPLDHEALNPPMWVKMKSINVLFLDMHSSAVTVEQRNRFKAYTVEDDNPHFPSKR